jgi:hypothetical protein
VGSGGLSSKLHAYTKRDIYHQKGSLATQNLENNVALFRNANTHKTKKESSATVNLVLPDAQGVTEYALVSHQRTRHWKKIDQNQSIG